MSTSIKVTVPTCTILASALVFLLPYEHDTSTLACNGMPNQRNAFEIATWPCSEEYLKDQSIVHPALEMLDGQPGLDE